MRLFLMWGGDALHKNNTYDIIRMNLLESETMPQLKERVNFTIDRDVRSRLETRVPRSKRSAFVERAIEKALTENAGQELLEWIDTMPTAPVRDGMGAVESLRLVRRDMQLDAVGLLSDPQRP